MGKQLNLEEFSDVTEVISALVSIDGSVKSKMSQVIKFCKTQTESTEWKRFDKLKYDDTEKEVQHLLGVLEKDPPGSEIDGLWFGLFNPVDESNEASAGIYISGNQNYSEEDPEWAVSPKYFPEERYFSSKALHGIYRIAYNEESEEPLENEAEYPLVLAYGVFLTQKLLSDERVQKRLERFINLGVMVGFDSGDSIHLGYIKSGQLVIKE